MSHKRIHYCENELWMVVVDQRNSILYTYGTIPLSYRSWFIAEDYEYCVAQEFMRNIYSLYSIILQLQNSARLILET